MAAVGSNSSKVTAIFAVIEDAVQIPFPNAAQVVDGLKVWNNVSPAFANTFGEKYTSMFIEELKPPGIPARLSVWL